MEQWASVFGSENILVRDYYRAMFPDGSIVNDVLKVLGVPELILKPKWWKFKANFNVRLPNNMVEIKRRINKKFGLPRFLDNTVVFLSQIIGNFVHPGEHFTKEQKKIVCEHFYGSNLELGNKYLDGNFPFPLFEINEKQV